jgi:RNA polymerase sigma factor (sigma-70 family)
MMKKKEYFKNCLDVENPCYKNEFSDDIVFARFIKYMKITLKHKRFDYDKHQNFLMCKEQKLSQEEWTMLSDKDSKVHSFCVFNDYSKLDLALEKLTPKQQIIIYMYYYKKETIAEISKELNITIDAVKQVKLRAIASLKRYMEDLKDE